MRSKAARSAAVPCPSSAAYKRIRTSVPMCGSTASRSFSSPAAEQPATARQAPSHLLVVLFQATVPVLVHLVRARNFRRTDKAESEPLGIRVIPDALRQLR